MASETQSKDKDSGSGNPLPPLPDEFAKAIELIDRAHAEDPNLIDGPQGPGTVPYELHYARKMTMWLAARCPAATPTLQVACRAQHFERWKLPRSSFPAGRAGYLTWRTKQKSTAAASLSALLSSSTTLPEHDVARAASLVRKEQLASDAETQVLEDVACLVFLDDQFDDFEGRGEIDEDKMVGILRKTWGKMSSEGRELALGMDLSPKAKALIGKALES